MKRSFKRCKSKYQTIFSDCVVTAHEKNIGTGKLVTFFIKFPISCTFPLFSLLSHCLSFHFGACLFIHSARRELENENLFLHVEFPIIVYIVSYIMSS